MDAYPLNLILAVATASATVFLGFLPTKEVSSAFFARETGKAIFAWGMVALTSPQKIFHYPLFFGFLCFAAWWHFRRDRALNGKMWLSVASGLGISIGVMFILAVTPQAYPPGLSPFEETLLLASIYLGGGVVGLAYVCYVLVQGTRGNSGVTQGIIRRYVGLLLFLVIARAVAMLISCFFSLDFGMYPSPHRLDFEYLLLSMVVIVMPVLAFFAQRATQFNSRFLPTRFLVGLILIEFLAEIGALHFTL